jgi:DNA-binding CsgD family transcriptional regulator/PAS domain-containing protein
MSLKRTMPGSPIERTTRVVDTLYASAIGSESFPSALGALGEALGARAVGMSLQHPPGWRWLGTAGFDPAPTAIMTRHYYDAATNPMVAVMGRLRPSVATHRREALSDGEYFGSGLYNDVFRPQKLVHAAIACGYRSGESFAPLGIFRDVRREEFGTDELKMLSLVLPHLARAIEVHLRIGTLLEQRAHFDLALDSLPFAVIFVDHRGTIWKANTAADAMIRKNDGLTISRKRLCAAAASEQRAVDAALARSIGEGRALDPSCGAALKISRPSARRPYSLLVLPLPAAGESGEIRPGSVIFVSDPDRRHRPSVGMLSQLFDLTQAQARLLARLVGGESLAQAAAAMGIAPATARTHLKALLQRTNTHRQSELTRLVMESPAIFRGAED